MAAGACVVVSSKQRRAVRTGTYARSNAYAR